VPHVFGKQLPGGSIRTQLRIHHNLLVVIPYESVAETVAVSNEDKETKNDDGCGRNSFSPPALREVLWKMKTWLRLPYDRTRLALRSL
jgi:hypothetical protein